MFKDLIPFESYSRANNYYIKNYLLKMIERSYEIIKHLNRLANDRSLPLAARNKVRDAAQHIKLLHAEAQNRIDNEQKQP